MEVNLITGLFLFVLAGANFGSSVFIVQYGLQSRRGHALIFGLLCAVGAASGLLTLLINTDHTTRVIPFLPLAFTIFAIVTSSVSTGAVVESWWIEGKPQPEPEPIPEVEPEPIPIPIPVYDTLLEDHRNEHGIVVAGTGHGKTQLFQSLILDDLEKDATIIVIDSQGQLINNLLHVVPIERLVHITPTDTKNPLALNLFDKDQDSSLYEYIFSALDAEMTSKQATLYRYMSRLVAVIPGGNIDTLRQLLMKGGIAPYREYVAKLNPVAQDFFTREFDGREYISTKEEISRRLYGVLENTVFSSMFMATENRLNLAKEINGRKVILIDTAKRTLSGNTFKIFGRFFIAQIARAIFSRDHPYPHRVYIYIDEAQEYFSDEDLLIELFTQSRKQNVALMIAFQFLAQLPEKVSRAVMANTSIKLAGGNSAGDKLTLAKEMNLPKEDLMQRPKGVFTIWYKQIRSFYPELFTVKLGRLEDMGRRSQDELDAIRHKMRQLYSRREDKATPPNTQTNSAFDDFEERT